jgi:hypothetical protein
MSNSFSSVLPLFLALGCSSASPSPATSPDGGAQVDAAQDAPATGQQPNSVTGTVQGAALTPAESVASFTDSFGAHYIGVTFSDRAGLCTAPLKGNTTYLLLSAETPVDPNGFHGFATGTYPIQVSGGASATFYRSDAACAPTSVDRHAVSGSVTLTEITSAHVRGTFELNFASDTLTGTFDAPFCAQALDGGVASCSSQ